MYNRVDLLAIKLDEAHINMYGCSLLRILFTTFEITFGYIEGGPAAHYDDLPQDKINIIKACYIVRFRSVKDFSANWTNIRNSLRQRTHDTRRALGIDLKSKSKYLFLHKFFKYY